MNSRIGAYYVAGLAFLGCLILYGRFDIAQAAPAEKTASLQLRPIDEAKALSNGIRKLSGKRITLYTDASGDEIDRLPEIFEQAFLQYCEYFHIAPGELALWSMQGFLMKDKSRFLQTGLLPGGLPDFPHGFSGGS